MHKTGVFVVDLSPFSERHWGEQTTIYTKLINDLSESRWTAFYSALKVTAQIVDELKKFSKAKPSCSAEDYHIQDSDPIDPSDNT
jgi:hypothetical protein